MDAAGGDPEGDAGLASGVPVMLWDIARASAMVAFACYTLTVAWGIVLAGRGFRPAARAMAYHRFLSSLGLCALAAHVASLMADRYARVHPSALLGMHTTPGRLMGAAALWLALALPLSMTLKRRGLLSARSWRRLHYLGYATWLLALLHGLATGSDTHSPMGVVVYAAAAALVAAAGWWRWLERPQPARSG